MNRIFSLFLLILISLLIAEQGSQAWCSQLNRTCIKSEEICGNGIDENCSGADAPCKNCSDSVIEAAGCTCESEKRYSGYCCNNSWQETPCGGNIYYLDVSGNDGNDGSRFRPWQSLHHCVSKLRPGDTVLVNPGRYVEKKQVVIKVSGKEGQPIMIKGNGKGVFIDFSDCPSKNAFDIYPANYVIIENLTVRASKNKISRGIRIAQSKNCVVRNCTVFGAGHANLFCGYSDRVLFQNNTSYNGHIGIYVSNSSDYPVVKGNTLYNNSSIGLHMNGDRHAGGDGTISYATVENNVIYDNGTGINLDGVTKSVFRNNLIFNNKKRGIALFKQDGAVPSNDNYVINNTIVMPRGAFYAIGLNFGAVRNTFYNNIIFTEGNVPCFSTTGKIGDLQVVSDYNLFPKEGKTWQGKDGAYRFGKWQRKVSEIANKLSNIFSSNNNDKHSIEGEISKTFLDPGNGDFRLRPDSPAINRGTSLHSFGKDLAGNIRPNPVGDRPDIGAYEYYGNEKNTETKSENQTQTNNVSKPNDVTKKKEIKNKFGMKFNFIPSGAFTMGILSSVPGKEAADSPHQVKLTRGFYIQVNEVTQGQWKMIMGKNPSFFKNCGKDCPVEMVSWQDVQEFIKRLNEIDVKVKYRLPTEAEWEYTCRARTDTPFSFGQCLSTDHANYCGNFPLTNCKKGIYREKTAPVENFRPNSWGLYNMHGNVWEWCQDWLGHYDRPFAVDPEGPSDGSLKVIRGGGWNSYASACRSGNRSGLEPDKGFANVGFRLVIAE